MKFRFGYLVTIWSFFITSFNVAVAVVATTNLVHSAFRVIHFTFKMREPSQFVTHHDYVLFANIKIIRINDLTIKPSFLLMNTSAKHNFLKSLSD